MEVHNTGLSMQIAISGYGHFNRYTEAIDAYRQTVRGTCQ